MYNESTIRRMTNISIISSYFLSRNAKWCASFFRRIIIVHRAQKVFSLLEKSCKMCHIQLYPLGGRYLRYSFSCFFMMPLKIT